MSTRTFPLSYYVKLTNNPKLVARDGFTLAAFVNISDAMLFMQAFTEGKDFKTGSYSTIRITKKNTVIAERYRP